MKTQTTAPRLRLQAGQFNLCVLASFLFLIWSAIFIWQSSFIALDGQRHFSLFDDAMISMRYAWNFAHGLGLVWNAGEYVEGYSNLLMTLIMSAASLVLDKESAVLTIQLLGIPTGLGIAFLTRQISRMLFPANTHLADLAFISILFYAPTWYWSLLGMESALLSLLLLASVFCALRWLKNRRSRELILTGVFLGLAFLTRNESLLLAGLVFGYLAFRLWRSKAQKADFLMLGYALLCYALFVLAQLGFRYWYYGSLVPNTYVLKVMGMPLSVKLAWGWKYIWVFLSQTWPLLCVALVGIAMHRSRDVIALAVPFLVLLVYQVSVGGDSFRVWRILLPGMPFIFILAALTIIDLSARFARQVRWLPFLLTLVLFVITGIPLWTFIYDEAGLMRQTTANQHNVNVALGINAVTSADATIGVIWAGAIPYYADRQAIDFLGKCDPYIASLPADLKMSVIGHNKYDLQYSIRKREPTYIQNFEWANENLKPWVVKHYIRANYATPHGDITLILKRNDPTVNWEITKLIPWPEDEQ